jgi:hypothetical protein
LRFAQNSPSNSRFTAIAQTPEAKPQRGFATVPIQKIKLAKQEQV